MTDTTTIRLCENEDVQAYNKTYANEIDRVEEICGNAVQETQDSIALVLSDIDSEQNKGKEEHDKEGEEKEPDNGIYYEPQGSIVLVDIQDTNTTLNAADSRQFVALDMDEITLHKLDSHSLKGGESTQHSVSIQDDDEIKLRSLSATLVYSGSFNGSTYYPGLLTVELKQVSKGCTSSIGHSPPDLQRPNSESQFGCATIQHELEETVINGGMFELVVTADNNVNYSISLGGRLACPLTKEVKRRLARVIATRGEIKGCKDQVSVLDKQLVLFERKRILEDELVNKSRDKSTKFLAEAERLDLELDYQDDEDEWKLIVHQIEKLKVDSTEACNVTAVRSKIKERLASDIQRSIEGRDLLQQKMTKLETKVDADVALLTSVVPNIWPSTSDDIIQTLLLESDDNT